MSHRYRSLRGLSSTARYKYLFASVVIFAIGTLSYYVIMYLQYRLWQALIVPVVVVLSFAFSPLFFRLINHSSYNAAGLLFLTLLVLVYGSNEAVWQNLTLPHVLTGLALVILVGLIALPGKVLTWVVLYLGYLLYISILGRLTWYPHLSTEIVPWAYEFSLATNILLVFFLLAQVALDFQARSIRTRLLITSVLLVFIPVLVVGLVSTFLNTRNARSQSFAQLQSILLLKQSQIAAWQDSLRVNLLTIAPQFNELPSIMAVIDQYNQTGNPSELLAYNNLVKNYASAVQDKSLFDEIFILNPQWRVVLSTAGNRIGVEYSSSPFLQSSLQAYSASPIFDEPSTQKPTQIITTPIRTQDGDVIAVFAARVKLDVLVDSLSQAIGLGETGETYIVTPDHKRVSSANSYDLDTNNIWIDSPGISAALKNENFYGVYPGYKGNTVFGAYTWLPDLHVALLAEQSQVEALEATNQVAVFVIVLMVLGVISAVGIGLYITNRIVRPLAVLAATAEKIAAGDLSLTAPVTEMDEIGDLGRSFNSMTSQLRTMVTGLELRVAERTHDLERQTEQLRTAAEVARDATALRDIDQLLDRSVSLIASRFTFDHVSIFLIDERNEYAVLSAAVGDGSDELLSQDIKVRVGNPGPLGNVAQTGQPYLTRDTSFQVFDPVMPDTLSRMVLPLKVGQRMVGLLDIQSKQADIFDESVLSIIQVVADQVAIALDSARLFQQMSGTLRELELLTGKYTQQSWRLVRQAMDRPEGYTYKGMLVQQAKNEQFESTIPKEPGVNRKSSLNIPLKLRDKVIGSLDLIFEGHEPNEEVQATLKEITQRLTLLMENARLVMEARSLAAREQQINQITTQVRSSVNLEAILRSTVRELGRAFGTSRTFIQIGLNPEGDEEITDDASGGTA